MLETAQMQRWRVTVRYNATHPAVDMTAEGMAQLRIESASMLDAARAAIQQVQRKLPDAEIFSIAVARMDAETDAEEGQADGDPQAKGRRSA